jgi:hypothetical protein
MTRQTFAVTAGLLFGVAGLTAQSGGGFGGSVGGGVAGGRGANSTTMEFQQAGTMGVFTSGSVTRTASGNTTGPLAVTGRPVSATEERKSVQTLGDGTEIATSESNLYFRDTEGRTRVEQTVQGKTVIAIMDPVARFIVTLDPANKTARKNAIPPDTNTGGLSIAGGGVSWSFGTSGGTGNRVSTGSIGVAGGSGTGGGVGVGGRGSASAGVMIARSGSFSTATMAPNSPNTKFTNEDLPVQSQNGVLATGTRSTMIIPQGQIGNNRDIHIVNERWYSDELQMLVKSVNSDPRFGDNIYQLNNISRVAPDPALFQIPPEYTVTEPPAFQGGQGQSVPVMVRPVIK